MELAGFGIGIILSMGVILVIIIIIASEAVK